MRAKPWQIAGPLPARSHDSLEDALRRFHLAEHRRPTDADRPPPSLFPMTRAARAALAHTDRTAETDR